MLITSLANYAEVTTQLSLCWFPIVVVTAVVFIVFVNVVLVSIVNVVVGVLKGSP